jgi:hypothetical protein
MSVLKAVCKMLVCTHRPSRNVSVLAGLLAALLSAPGHAQVYPPGLLPKVFQMPEPTKADAAYVGALRPYADCIVAHHPVQLMEFLDNQFSEKGVWAERKMAKANPDCPRPKGTDPSRLDQVRGAIFEAMLRTEFSGITMPPNYKQVPALLYLRGSDLGDIRKMNAALMVPFDCVAHEDPRSVQTFLSAEPRSAAEASEFVKLQPVFARCMLRGDNWKLNAFGARPMLAEALYTLVKYAQPKKASS